MPADTGASTTPLERIARKLATDRVLLWILGGCLVLLAAAAAFPVPQTAVGLSLRVRDVRMRMASDYGRDVDVLLEKGASLTASRFDRINTFEPACQTPQEFTLKGELSIAKLKLLAGAELAVGVSGAQGLDLTIVGPAAVQIVATGRVQQNGRLCSKAGAMFDLDADKGREARLVIDTALGPTSDFRLKDLWVSELRFVHPAAGTVGLTGSDSSIRSGSLFVGESDKPISLREGEVVTLDGVAGTVQTIALDKDDLYVEFRGRVDGVALGPATDRRDLRPTILVWLSHSDWLTTSGTVLGAVLLILWRVRVWVRNEAAN